MDGKITRVLENKSLGYRIEVVTEFESGLLEGASLNSNLMEQLIESDPVGVYGVGEAQADALEAFLLNLACEGVDISTPEFHRALDATLEAIANNS